VSKRIVYFCLFLSLLLLFYYPPVSLAFLGIWGPFLMGDDDDPCGKETWEAWVPPSIAFSIPTPSQNQCISFSYKTCLSLFVSINFGYKYFPSI
jgi:hypothetical protein